VTDDFKERARYVAEHYNEMCEAAATAQGLDPITAVLREAGIPYAVDQTGGFTMCVNVPLVEGGSQYLYLTAAGGILSNAEPDDVAICRYWEGGVDGCEWGSCYAEVRSVGVTLDELVAVVRAEQRNAPVPCPYSDQAWHK
jgi:hypothetical protein